MNRQNPFDLDFYSTCHSYDPEKPFIPEKKEYLLKAILSFGLRFTISCPQSNGFVRRIAKFFIDYLQDEEGSNFFQLEYDHYLECRQYCQENDMENNKETLKRLFLFFTKCLRRKYGAECIHILWTTMIIFNKDSFYCSFLNILTRLLSEEGYIPSTDGIKYFITINKVSRNTVSGKIEATIDYLPGSECFILFRPFTTMGEYNFEIIFSKHEHGRAKYLFGISSLSLRPNWLELKSCSTSFIDNINSILELATQRNFNTSQLDSLSISNITGYFAPTIETGIDAEYLVSNMMSFLGVSKKRLINRLWNRPFQD